MGWSGGNFVRTNGTYTGTTIWQNDATASVKIQAVRHDTHDQDLANGVSACLNKNGQNSPLANIDWGGYKITNLGAGTSATDAAQYGQTISGAALNSSTKILTLTRPDGVTYTIDFTPLVTANDTSDFGRLSQVQTWAQANRYTVGIIMGTNGSGLTPAQMGYLDTTPGSLGEVVTSCRNVSGVVYENTQFLNTGGAFVGSCLLGPSGDMRWYNSLGALYASVYTDKNLTIQNIAGLTISASAPFGAPSANSLWICTTGGSKGFYIYSGGSWVLIAS